MAELNFRLQNICEANENICEAHFEKWQLSEFSTAGLDLLMVKHSIDPSSSHEDANYLERMVFVCSIQLARSPKRLYQLQAQDQIFLSLVLGHSR